MILNTVRLLYNGHSGPLLTGQCREVVVVGRVYGSANTLCVTSILKDKVSIDRPMVEMKNPGHC